MRDCVAIVFLPREGQLRCPCARGSAVRAYSLPYKDVTHDVQMNNATFESTRSVMSNLRRIARLSGRASNAALGFPRLQFAV